MGISDKMTSRHKCIFNIYDALFIKSEKNRLPTQFSSDSKTSLESDEHPAINSQWPKSGPRECGPREIIHELICYGNIQSCETMLLVLASFYNYFLHSIRFLPCDMAWKTYVTTNSVLQDLPQRASLIKSSNSAKGFKSTTFVQSSRWICPPSANRSLRWTLSSPSQVQAWILSFSVTFHLSGLLNYLMSVFFFLIYLWFCCSGDCGFCGVIRRDATRHLWLSCPEGVTVWTTSHQRPVRRNAWRWDIKSKYAA